MRTGASIRAGRGSGDAKIEDLSSIRTWIPQGGG
jgi:hypothetical protein